MDLDDLDSDPLAQFRSWFDEAVEKLPSAAAMTLATVDHEGRPSARIVLLRGLDEDAFVFFTNRESRKGLELAANPRAALVFHWWELGRQVRVEGDVEQASAAASEQYWRTRPRSSQIAAWASPQSERLVDRNQLDAAVAAAEARFEGTDVPLPLFWGGFRVVPDVVEFWVHRDDRLHDRVRYTRTDAVWVRERLAP